MILIGKTCSTPIPLGRMNPSSNSVSGELPARFHRDSDTDLSLAVSLYLPDLFHCRSHHPRMFSNEVRRFWSGAREEILRHFPLPPGRWFRVMRLTSDAFCTSELGQPGHYDKVRIEATAQCAAICSDFNGRTDQTVVCLIASHPRSPACLLESIDSPREMTYRTADRELS